ncbi:DNA ligase-1 [Mumia flava]|uniref:DNA ligase n=1 Tax=Mumia flava TaxID=1348852 RepID=A0A0B2BD76_9ACTN|nr:ATP-dependent DNA ligase [Mumia flava]PJJ55928.1 DNA ligase-1 [Mumia flava]
MLLADVVATSRAVAATRSRLAKRAAIAELLAATPPDALEVVVTYLAGELRQRRTGLGWASMRDLPDPAAEPSLDVVDVDAAFETMAAMSGPGSAGARTDAAAALFGAATADEQAYLRGLVSGDVRQGALDSVVADAVAEAAGLPAADVRRAVMLRGALAPVASAALSGGAEAVAGFRLEAGRAVRPMLASSAPDVAAALEKIGAGSPTSVDTKLDGIRIQVHRVGDDVRVYTRSLDDITERVGSIVEAVRGLSADTLVLDGEAVVIEQDGRPAPFQDIASLGATRVRPEAPDLSSDDVRVLSPVFFDVLHVDGEDLIDRPLSERLEVLDRLAPGLTVPRLRTADGAEATTFFDDVVDRGYEGVVVKALDAPYEAGRRGAAWVKVKPRHTLDLVVLAVEWGSGRRKGWLSNIHLGARDPDGGGFVMLGKTFKGMTDEILAWQTERFTELATDGTDDWVVTVRPEQVVEIAFDGVQRSPRYPGGVALRFARVLRYRDDKPAAEADTIDAVRALL